MSDRPYAWSEFLGGGGGNMLEPDHDEDLLF
jgi:hypothetical protein